MTHSILMTIKIKDYDDIKEIQERMLDYDNDSWLTMFGFRKVPKDRCYPDFETCAGMPPFVCFPKQSEKEEDGLYHIIVESGSHCGFYDTQESLMMWVSWFSFIQEIDSFGINFTYGIGTSGEEGKLNLNQSLKKIITDTELAKIINIKSNNIKTNEYISIKDLYAWIGEFDAQTDGNCSGQHVLSELSKYLKQYKSD